jgi:hypothetical protein
MFGILKRWRRKRILRRPVPEAWRGIVAKNVPYARRLPPENLRGLERLVQVFVAEKNFEGCGGLEMSDEIRVTIAAQACILLLHREHDYYAGLDSIVVYPRTYSVPVRDAGPGGVVSEHSQARLGEAWLHGTIVLSWDAVKRAAADVHDGDNVVLHEFAHELDQQDGNFDGAPVLSERSRYVSWARVLGAEFQELRDAAEKGRETVLGKYGAKDPAEFFAVITECFFEKPKQLQQKHPELYDELKGFYRQDPAALADASGSGPPSE